MGASQEDFFPFNEKKNTYKKPKRKTKEMERAIFSSRKQKLKRLYGFFCEQCDLQSYDEHAL